MDSIDGWPPPDPLGDALHLRRMIDAFYCRSELGAPLVPHGNGHLLRSEPGVVAPGIEEPDREHLSNRYEVLRHGAGGAQTILICGAVRFDHPATQPRLDAAGDGWLGALQDRQIGRALALMHGEPARAWTVASSADEPAMSRSALAFRFTEFVDGPVIQYVTHWRMQVGTGRAQAPSRSSRTGSATAPRPRSRAPSSA